MIREVFIAALSLVGLQDGPRMLLPGVVDLPLLNGAAYSADCGGMRNQIGDFDAVDCLATTASNLNGTVAAYMDEALTRGWRFSAQVPGSIWLERPGPVGRCEQLSINLMTPDEPVEEPDDAGSVYLAFLLDADVPCVGGRRG